MRWLLRLFGLDGYEGFVARRYLMNPEIKVSRRVRWAIAICAVIYFPLANAVGLGVKATTGPGRVLMGIEAIAALGLMIAVVGGVLRYSKPAFYGWLTGFVLVLVGASGMLYASHRAPPETMDDLQMMVQANPLPGWFGTAVLIVLVCGSVIAGLCIFFGMLRAFFTFFTTVPIGGVWLGTMSLVCVLSVMSGFETDLRDKILGSNAHINVTREDGDIDDWRALKAKIDQVPGVVASTPYAQSEVVIANNNGTTVIIKGIDPKTVGKVTRLVQDISDEPTAADKEAAMARLEPLIQDNHELYVKPRTVTGPVIDPPPSDLPSTSDPIDFSKPATPDGSAAPPPVPLPPLSPIVGSGSAAVGSARDIFGSDDSMRVPIDASFDSPAMSRRTQSLPGILVGKELEKTMHLYEGEEVRVVSPLSDPSNPDATGTPIPFNRDYRVAGFFFTGMYEYDLKYVYVTLDSLQEFLDRGSVVDGIEVRTTDPDKTDTIVPRIAAALGPSYRVQDWKEINRGLFSALKLEKIAMFVVLGIVILVASFSIVGNLIMVVVEKGREIALIKTLGASDSSVMQLFAIQGLLIGLIGTTLGVAFGLAGCYLGKHFGIPLDPNVYYINRMPIHVDASSVVVTFLAGVVISIAATLYPALLAARIRPATGIRH